MQLDPFIVKQQIAAVIAANPELQDDEVLRADMLEGETDAFSLLTQIVRRIEDTKALIDGTKGRLDELKARKDRFGLRVDGLRSLAMQIMEAADLTKAELPEATISVRKGAIQLVGDADPASLPDDLCKIKRDLDRAAIKEAISNGRDVGGFALSNGAPSLMVRIK